MSVGTQTSRLAVLVFTDVVGSSELKNRLGVLTYAKLLARHDAIFRELLAEFPSAEVLQDTGDGFFAAFQTVGDAVRFALRFQDAMHREPWGTSEPFQTRVGIHLGELAHVAGLAGGPQKVVGIAADLTHRVMTLACGGQILLTRAAFDEARQFVSEYPSINSDPPRALRWMAHGDYLFHGAAEPVQVFEVGGDGIAPLSPPRDREKARRSRSEDNKDEILGWRPAIGLAVPQAPAWVLEKKLGEGTFGEVWLAHHATLRQKRVFKFCFDAVRLESFKRELTLFRLLRDALGERPDIARLHDVCFDRPPFFLETEYAPAGNLIDWAAAQGGLDRVPLETRLEIVAQVCDAVAAAHSVGVLHKDIKPSNILMHAGKNGAAPRPQLADFGIGLLTDKGQLAAHHITEAGFTSVEAPAESSRSGTRIYMPPEAMVGRPFTIQGDIYALGILLYQMVVADLTRPMALGWERDVEDELLREDIAACVDGDPERRINSSTEVATRLRRLAERRAGRAAEAHHREVSLHRHRLLRIAAAVLIVLIALSSLAVVGFFRERHLRVVAQKAYADGAIDQGIALHLVGRATQSRAAFIRARNVFRSLDLSPLAAEAGLFRSYKEFAPPINTLVGHTGGLLAVAVFRDGTRACSAGEDKAIRVWDLLTGRELRTLTGHTGTVGAVAVSPDGLWILSGSQDNTVRLWDLRSGTHRVLAKTRGEVRGVAFSPNGNLALWATTKAPGDVQAIVITGESAPVRTFEPPCDPQGQPYQDQQYYAVAFSPDGRLALASTYQGRIWIFDVATGAPQPKPLEHPGKVLAAAFSRDGTRVISGSGQSLRCFRIDTGEWWHVGSHTAAVRGLAFVGAGHDRALACDLDGGIALWDVAKGQIVSKFAGHEGGVRAIAIVGEGDRAVSAGMDATVCVWNLSSVGGEVPAAHEGATVTSLACSPDGLMLLVGDERGRVRLRDRATMRILRTFEPLERAIDCVAFLGGEHQVFAADSAGATAVWDLSANAPPATRPSRVEPKPHGRVRDRTWCYTAVARDGSFAISSNEDRRVMDVWSLRTGQLIATLQPAEGERAPVVTSVRISPDGKCAVTGDGVGRIQYWDPQTGRPLLPAPHQLGNPGPVTDTTFSADGESVLTTGYDPVVRLWQARGSTKVREFPGHTDIARSALFGGTGGTIFSAGSDRTMRMWDLQTAAELPLAARLDGEACAMTLIPPDDAVAVGAGAMVTIWDPSRARRHLEFQPRLDAARAALRANPEDPAALAVLGEWYAFRGAHDWAAQLLEGAAAGGASVSLLTLAESYWQLDRRTEAAKAFQVALVTAPPPATYPNLCLSAVMASPTSTPTTRGAAAE